MSLAELLPAARALDDRDKLRLIRELAHDLAGDDSQAPALPPLDFLAYTPLEAYGAAAIMQQMLAEKKDAS